MPIKTFKVAIAALATSISYQKIVFNPMSDHKPLDTTPSGKQALGKHLSACLVIQPEQLLK